VERFWGLAEGNRTRIALLDDHTLFRELLAQRLALEPDLELVCQCGTVHEMLEFIARTPVDLILLDINLGAEQGGSFLTRARVSGFRGKVLVLTAGVGNREAAWLIDRGCSGIVFKNEPSSLLLERIRQVIAGTEPKPHFERGAEAHEPSRTLTAREREVLGAVCQGLANKEIAQRLNISENSVKSFLQQLFQKTGVRTRAQLVAAAIETYWDQLQ
jgi:two-component system nitrate/nitrite response regulator NarL